MEHPYVVASAGALIDQAGHEHERLYVGIVLRLGTGDANPASAGERKRRPGCGTDSHRFAKIRSRNEGHDPCPLKAGAEYSHRPKAVNRSSPSAAGRRSHEGRRINHVE